jgi:hypothetical protein
MRGFLLLLAAVVATAADLPTAPAVLSADQIFSRLIEKNRERESLLRSYSVRRTYSASNTSGKQYAEEDVRMSCSEPAEKKFELISARGSWLVRSLVFSRLRESEATAAGGKERNDSSITPANYRLEALGTEELNGRLCYVVEAIPLRKDKYLFEGRAWVDAADFAVARIAARPARNPSFWIRQVEFVRTYAKIGDFWLPFKDETVADIRAYGHKILTIDHYDYVLNAGEEVANR